MGGAFADALTWVRFLLTPVIMFVIIKGGWPGIDMALMASMLFAIAALTDLFDDVTGGAETARMRKLGWFDDIADTVLITGTLAAIVWVLYVSGSLTWVLAVPALVIIIRDCLVAILKGKMLRKTGWPETRLGTLKTAVTMLAVCLLVASPWVSNWIGAMTATETDIFFHAPWVGRVALGLLWISAVLSAITGAMILSGRTGPANDA